SRGYITLRLPECLASRTVPIYLGCSNVEDYVPADCFIDYREFGSCSRLNEYLLDMSEATYRAYVSSIDQWLRAGNLPTYCRDHLYDRLAELLAGSVGKTVTQLWGLDAGWTVVDMPDEPSSRRAIGDGSLTASTEMHPVRYWTWSHLALGSLEDCAASLDMMRETQTLGGSVANGGPAGKGKPREVRRVLYLGVQSSYGDRPEELDYNIRNLLKEWDAWRDVEVHHIDPVARSLLVGTAGMSKEVLDCALRGGFDTVFCVPVGPPFDVLPDVMRRITLHAKTVVWLPHKPQVFQTHSLPWASCVDRVVTTSDKDRGAFAEAGHADRVTKSHWAFSPRTYRRVRVERAPVVTLVGQQTQVRAEACDYLAGHGVKIAAYGRGWGDDRFLTDSGFQRSLSESAINLNLGGRRRVFETTGSGGFLMTTPVEGLEDAFITDDVDPDRAEVVVVNDTDELLHKARHYMEHPAAREAIARRGFRRAHAEHTWKHRFAAVFSESGWALPN
ncbi:MAG: glycosyltransferase, partial [Candidatus Poribacteria bacterium]